jgi:hypothetical protein
MMKPQEKASRWGYLFEGFLIVLTLIGVWFRFTGVNWNQGTNLHPDEYGLTNTLTQLKMPDNLGDYFNTRVAPLSPYDKYDLAGQKTDSGPDNRMRWGQWPLILLRASAELTDNTGYSELRLMGRQLSALVDTLALILIFLIGQRLYGRKVGLLAAALSALAVLQIQQSHFMTVDTFAVLFAVLTMYAAVRIAQQPVVIRQIKPLSENVMGSSSTLTPGPSPWKGEGSKDIPASSNEGRIAPLAVYRPDWNSLRWYVLFGVGFGMAVASKVNLLPLGGMILIATILSIADLKLRTQDDLKWIFGTAAAFMVVAGLVTLLTFRLTQPMSFRAAQGDTTVLTMLQFNPDWVDSMKVAQSESDGSSGGGPPGEQWANRTIILFPLINMVLWGMGIPLGLTAWAGFLAALWQWVRYGRNWRVHLLPLVWVGGYFLFMATRWVKSIRYFLPIYPFLCLFAAWGLLTLWNYSRTRGSQKAESVAARPQLRRTIPAGILLGGVLLGTLVWATAFTSAIYWTENTRLQATLWTFENIPAPFHLTVQLANGQTAHEPITAPDELRITSTLAFVQSFQASATGKVTEITIPHIAALGKAGRLHLILSKSIERDQILAETDLIVAPGSGMQPGGTMQAAFPGAALEKDQTYYLIANVPEGQPEVMISHTVISNETWDESLPVPFAGRDPFSQMYTGIMMQIRWADDENKREMLLDTIAKSDYIFLQSQRAVWASCRLPRMYPMTMAYYRALFSGQLGFERVALFSAPLRAGPLYFSDLAGSVAWGQSPELPVFNHSPFAAEEAFSVYDHAPVWIFRKRTDFKLETVRQLLYSVDLSQAVIQSPINVPEAPCPD